LKTKRKSPATAGRPNRAHERTSTLTVPVVRGDSNDVLKAAIEARNHGWSVIPIRFGTKNCPGIKWTPYKTQRASEPIIRKWFRDEARRNIAVVLGAVSGGLACRDFDTLESYDQWAAAHPELAAKLPTVATARPGRHVYFGVDVERATKLIGGNAYKDLGDGELRVSACYCLLPPSLHPTGIEYRWKIPPNGAIPFIEDLEGAGLARCWSCNTEDTVGTESAGELKTNQDIRGVDASDCDPPVGADDSHGSSNNQPTSPCLVFSVLHDSSDYKPTVEAAIVATLPKVVGHRHKRVFELCRAFRGIPTLAGAPFPTLKPLVKDWYKRACQRVEMPAFDLIWADFVEGWDKVRHPAGSEPIRTLFARARKAEMPKVAEDYSDPKLRLLIALCRELQGERRKGQPFYLAIRTAAVLLQIEATTAWRWLKVLQADRIIKLVKVGSVKEHRASEFVYLHDI
jgi:hypothetical protein